MSVDRSVTLAVTNLITSHAPQLLVSWEVLCRDRILPDINCHGNEINALNRFWRRELGALPFCTIALRACLDDLMSPQDWIYNFNRYILPIVIRHSLPKGV